VVEAPSHDPGKLRDSLVALVSSIAGVEADGATCLAALGLDSLGLLELSLRVERHWGVKLGVWSDLQAKLTLEALATLIEQVYWQGHTCWLIS
jgi:acyl carrier protein